MVYCSKDIWGQNAIFTARKRSLRRLCFHRCLSVHIACWDTPSWADNILGRHTPPGRHPPPRADTHTPDRQTRPRQTHPRQTPPCTVHAEIWSTSGQYISHWNAFLFDLHSPHEVLNLPFKIIGMVFPYQI